MAENSHDLEQPEVKHEERDVNAWAVGKFAIALVMLCGIALLILAGLFKYFAAREGGKQPVSSGINVDARKLPPEPRLQDTPVLDLEQMKAAEDQVLNGYGWVDQQNGIVRIPIQRAMDLLAQRGLPSRAQGTETTARTASIPTESGLGYIMQQPGGPLAADAAAPAPPAPPVKAGPPAKSFLPAGNEGKKK